ncbi:hypothetical protein [Chelativorans sp. YIM 93263]|uniref:hypothetical protein n=1 Tax=Chelativorans sp. YIM 93263 TaxID=2906648 RepID=UPI002378081C|nr:hypothetical protein [Chelativorans sp. YIM 93263]
MSRHETKSDRATEIQTRDLIVMHLREAARLSVTMKGEIDIELFKHLIGMAVYAAREGQEENPTRQDRMRLHS